MQTASVEELMLPLTDYTCVSEESTLYDAFIALEGALQGIQKADPSHPRDFAVLVLDANGDVLGRLVVWDKQGKAIEPEFEPSIGLVEDPQEGVMGPIWVRGGILVDSASGTTYEIRNRVTLCRCGKSSNKPFCDSSHVQR